MKYLLKQAALVALTLVLTQCATSTGAGHVYSVTYLDAGKQFVLGGGQPGAFWVSVKNAGPEPVTVQERRANGTVQERGTLAPRQQTRLDLAPGSAALVLNASNKQAVLDLELGGGASGLGMRYEGLK